MGSGRLMKDEDHENGEDGKKKGKKNGNGNGGNGNGDSNAMEMVPGTKTLY